MAVKSNKQLLIDKIVELIAVRYVTDEDRALLETFITRLDLVLVESKLSGLVLKNVWLSDDALFYMVDAGTPSMVIPGKSNKFASVTGNFLSHGGWGTATDGQMECPRCNGDRFVFSRGEGEYAVNHCRDCGYRESFIKKL